MVKQVMWGVVVEDEECDVLVGCTRVFRVVVVVVSSKKAILPRCNGYIGLAKGNFFSM